MPAAEKQPWKKWNEKLHVYLGLYFLVFLWLFAASGLLLNHDWRWTEFWNQRRQAITEHRISVPDAPTNSGRAADLMRQLGVAGELEWTAAQPRPNQFEFRVSRPGRIVDVKADFARHTATLQEIRVNGWGMLRALHTFNGTRINAPTAERDWWLTKLWTWSMDAVAIGMILLVATSVGLACSRRERWRGSAVALGIGVVLCGFFVLGLRWL